MKSGSEDKGQRRGSRTKAVFPVRIKGKNSSGEAFEELAHTLDVTANGVRLGAIRQELSKDEEITLFYRQRKMQYRVVWTKKLKGTSEFQVGLTAVSQDREAWGLNPADFKAEPNAVAVSRASGVA
ncbi:MAG TPA: PilZ domain-containing protein [Candidatus Sulfotelmatobacter sp.]|nr:PilZ domain-containing protein [Candidatus Sulfotelmatobacter sp.]